VSSAPATICIQNGHPELLSLHLKRLSETAHNNLTIGFEYSVCERMVYDIAKDHPNSGLRISFRNNGLQYDVLPIGDTPINATFTYMPDYNLDRFAKRRCLDTSNVTMYYDKTGILEGNWFSVFFLDTNKNLCTPPLGRILAGTMRAAILYTAQKRDVTIQIKSQPPNHNFTYYASTSMRVLQPIHCSNTATQQLNGLRDAVRESILNEEPNIYDYWLRECESIIKP
jgi:hypothetical protein